MPFRGRECSPVAPMCGGWPNYYWQQGPTVCTYTLNGSHHCALNTSTSVVSQIVLTYQDFDEPSIYSMTPVLSML